MRHMTRRFFCPILLLGLALLPSAWSRAAAPVHTLIVQPDDGRTAILDQIQGATGTIHLTIYEINDPAINQALIAAAGRGVSIRILYNYYSFLMNNKMKALEPVLESFKAAGIQTQAAPKFFEVTHQKTFTFDGHTSIIMTFNLQPSYFGGTRDFGVITTDPAEIAEITRVFEADWADAQIVPDLPQLVWSPVNSRTKLTALITNATRTLEIYNEEMMDAGIAGALIAAHERGVAVRCMIANMCRAGADPNAFFDDDLLTNGIPVQNRTNLYYHAKMILADFGTPAAAAYLGSENFGRVSLGRNRELGIIVSEPAILDRLHTTFTTDWAPPLVPPGL